MKWSQIKIIAKWMWLLAILVFMCFYLEKRLDLIKKSLCLFSYPMIIISAFFIGVAKFLLVKNMKIAVSDFGTRLTFSDSYRIYNGTQLAKYIPGSVWQFIGRIVILKGKGLSNNDIRDSLLAEQSRIIGSACLLAIILISLSKPDFFLLWVNKYGLGNWFLIGLIAAVGILLLIVFFLRKELFFWAWRLRPGFYALIILILIWLSLGLSFWVTLAPFVKTPVSFSYIIGIYCFAFAVGFLVPFAPAGLGVRDGVLAFAMLSFMPIETALLLSGVNRVIYIGVEILLVLPLPLHFLKSKILKLKGTSNN